MDSNLLRLVRHLALLCVVAGTMALTTTLPAGASQTAGQEPPDSQAKKIHGAWLLQVDASDCQTSAPTGSFQSLVTFAQGGTLTNVTTGASPGLRTTGLGTWQKAGDHEFTSVAVAFLFSPAGVWTATQRIANTFEIGSNPDELTGTTEVNFFDTNENLVSTACATVLGHRLD